MNVIDSIHENPEDWILGTHHLVHKNGDNLWIANGMFFINFNGLNCYSLWEKYKIWKAVKWWIRNKPLCGVK